MTTRTVEDVKFAQRVGRIIRWARLSEKLTQDQLAERISISQSALCEIEKGYSAPTIWLLRRIILKGLGLKLRIVVEKNGTKIYEA